MGKRKYLYQRTITLSKYKSFLHNKIKDYKVGYNLTWFKDSKIFVKKSENPTIPLIINKIVIK